MLAVRNVRTFGAHGDGVHDDTDAVQEAVDVDDTRCIIYFPRGTYLVRDLKVGRAVDLGTQIIDRHARGSFFNGAWFLGDGPTASVLKRISGGVIELPAGDPDDPLGGGAILVPVDSPPDAPIATFAEAWNLIIEGLGFDLNGVPRRTSAGALTHGLPVAGLSFFECRNVVVERCRFFDGTPPPAGEINPISDDILERSGISFEHNVLNAEGLPSTVRHLGITIAHNRFEGVGIGVHNVDGLQIRSNTILRPTLDGILCSSYRRTGHVVDTTIADNLVVGAGRRGIAMTSGGGAATRFERLRIFRNRVEDSASEGIRVGVARFLVAGGLVVGLTNRLNSGSGALFRDIVVEGNDLRARAPAAGVTGLYLSLLDASLAAEAEAFSAGRPSVYDESLEDAPGWTRFERAVVRNNRLVGQGDDTAIACESLCDSVVAGNLVTGYGRGIALSDGLCRNHVHGNWVPAPEGDGYTFVRSVGNNAAHGNSVVSLRVGLRGWRADVLQCTDYLEGVHGPLDCIRAVARRDEVDLEEAVLGVAEDIGEFVGGFFGA